LFDETLNIQNKMQSVFEIINTPGIVIENVENDDDDFPTMITLRRTHKVFCNYCPNIWGTVLYGGNGNRVCFRCEYEIAKEVRRREKNIKIISDTIEKKKLFMNRLLTLECILAEFFRHN